MTQMFDVGEMRHRDEVLRYYKLLQRIIHVIIDNFIQEPSGVYIDPLGDWKPLGLRSPSGDVRGVKIPPNIILSKGLRSPWTVPGIGVKIPIRRC